MVDSRTQKSVKNAKTALTFYCINLILQFFSRKVFLEHLGSELLGLNTTAQNILGFLNLAELGIGTAVAYCLYKPLYEEDKITIIGITSVQGWLYRRITIIVCIGAAVLMCFFPLIFRKTDVPALYTYGSFLVLLFSSLLSYLVNYRQIVLSADQKQYKITYVTQGVKVAKVILQIILICTLSNGYVWWMVLEIIFAIVSSIILEMVINKEYPWLKPQITKGAYLRNKYPLIIKKTKQLFFHKIGSYVLTQTSPIIIYAYASLTMVAIYGNYMLIVTGLIMLVNSLLNGIGAGVGNLVAEGDKKKIKNFFWELTSLRLWMAAVICFALYMLGHSFISLWVGAEFLMPKSAFIVLIIITFIQLTRTNDIFISAYGLFEDIWAPIAEAAINLGMSALLGYFWGLTGILIGVSISLITIVCCWKPYFLYKRGFNEKVRGYFLRISKLLSLLVGVSFACNWLITDIFNLSNPSTWCEWLTEALVSVAIYSLFSLLILCGLDDASRSFSRRLIGVIIRKN